VGRFNHKERIEHKGENQSWKFGGKKLEMGKIVIFVAAYGSEEGFGLSRAVKTHRIGV
jgi:hypothetical protein